MILLQNPTVPIPTVPVEIDAAILDVKAKLEADLSWLTNGYGRCYKNIDSSTGQVAFYPEAYLGTQNNSQRYVNISPDNDKQGQCFFYVTKETVNEFQQGQYGFLSYNVSIIFSVNMELISETILETEIFQQNLIAEARNVLIRGLGGTFYQLRLDSTDLEFSAVFGGFNIPNPQQAEKAPLSHWKMNCVVVLPEACPVPTLAPSVAAFNSFQLDGVNEYIRPASGFLAFQDRLDPFSLSFWIKPTAFSSIDAIFHKYDAFAETGILFWSNISQVIEIALVQGSITSNALRIQGGLAVTIQLGVWQHVGLTYSGSGSASGLEIYYNGVQKSRVIIQDSLTTSILNTTDAEIGGVSPVSLSTDFTYNVCRMWDIELSEAEVLTEYNLGVPLVTGVQEGNLIMDMKGAEGSTWNGSNFEIPDPTGVTVGYVSVNLEEADAVADFPT